MALTFTNGSADRVAVASASAIDSLASTTLLIWVLRTDFTQGRRYWSKQIAAGGASARHGFLGIAGAGEVQVLRQQTTTQADYRTNNASISSGVWTLLGYTYTDSGSNRVKIYRGTLTSLATECTYSTASDGSGTVASDATQPMYWANFDGFNASFAGSIAYAALFNRVLDVSEIVTWQFHPSANQSGCVHFLSMGYNGTGTQADLSGNATDGTVTTATVGDHVPIPYRRVRSLHVPYSVAAGGGVKPWWPYVQHVAQIGAA